MGDKNNPQAGAAPAAQAAVKALGQELGLEMGLGEPAKPVLTRRDHFAIAFGAAILNRQAGRTPSDLVREVMQLTDLFLAKLDGAQQ